MNFLKRNFSVLSFILLNFVFLVFYLFRSSANIVYSDQFYSVDMVVRKVLEKDFDIIKILIDSWYQGGIHKGIGGIFLTLLNLKLFKLNTLIDIYGGAVTLLLTSLVLYIYSVKNKIVGKKLPKLLFLPIPFIIMSLDQVELLTFGNGFYLFLRMLLFIITFIAFEKLIWNINLKNIILFITPFFLNLFFFSGGYTIPFLISLLIIFSINYPSNKKIKTTKFLVAVPLGTIVLALVIYGLGGFNQTLPYSLDPLSKNIFPIDIISQRPLDFAKFFILSLTGNIVDVNLLSIPYFSFLAVILLPVGITLFIIYLYAIYIYFKNKLYKKSYLPLFFIIYSFFIYIGITITRFNFSMVLPYYSMSSRYSADTHFGLIGIILILTMTFTKVYKKNVLMGMILIFILAGQMMTYYWEWQAGPYRKLYFDDLRKIALKNTRTKTELRLFQVYDLNLVEKSLDFLRVRKLNVYSD